MDPELSDWLLDSDPSIRWQVTGDPAERARIATEGWGAQLLARQDADGSWGGTEWNRGWDSTMHVLMLLRDLGLDPASPQAQRALAMVRDKVTWRQWSDNPFFAGEDEPCINGQVAAAGAYFGEDVSGLVDRLLGEQRPDGGWNCEPDPGSSYNTTICVLEALLAYADAAVTDARRRGEEYLLSRGLFRRSTGEPILRDNKGGSDWTRFAFPTWWHYDVLRGLDHLRAAEVTDERTSDAVRLVESQRGPDGRWVLGVAYPGTMPVDLGESEGQPSRWITLRAQRVLDRHWERREP